MNKLYYDDNLTILKELPDNSIDLIYADPPFNTGKDWGAFNDKWEKGLAHYLDFMRPRIEEIHRVLNDTGSFYLHCNPTASHYLKVLCDQVFGIANFRSEIIWYKYNKRDDRRIIWRSYHDVLLYFSKGRDRIRNTLTMGTGEVIERENTRKLKGKLVGTGEHIIYERQKNLTRNVIDNIPDINIGSGVEKLHYPTQKPVALLERIIKASSNEGDVVLDAFCGSGTTLDAAHGLQRSWIGIDEGQQAIETITFRLANQHGLLPNDDYELLGGTDSIELPTANDATPQQTKLF